MPHVHISITEGATTEQKAELIRRATEMMADVLKKDRSSTFVTIQEFPADNWGVGGESVSMRRRKAVQVSLP